MDLDDEYGPSLPFARGASEAEMSVMPRSVQVLDAATAPALKAYMDSAFDLRLPQVLHATTPILWLIDRDGNVRFALEEVLARDTGSVSYILSRNGPPMRETDVRLGHPALLEPVEPGVQKSARIGGEIFYDPVATSPNAWVLTNNSGRFGKRSHITRRHLENAKAAFAGFDIYLRAFFIYTPDRSGDQR